jgi:hypothetical protein
MMSLGSSKMATLFHLLSSLLMAMTVSSAIVASLHHVVLDLPFWRPNEAGSIHRGQLRAAEPSTLDIAGTTCLALI